MPSAVPQLNHARISLAFLLPLAIVFVIQFAPAQDFHGSLVGTVQDASSARIPSAKIVIRASESSVERQTSSDASGEFRLDDLLPGAYHVAVDAAGFTQAIADVRVVVSSVQH